MGQHNQISNRLKEMFSDFEYAVVSFIKDSMEPLPMDEHALSSGRKYERSGRDVIGGDEWYSIEAINKTHYSYVNNSMA